MARVVKQTMKCLSQREAQRFDEQLMGKDYGFAVEQLMELAGLSCACAVAKAFPVERFPRVAVVCGPGNNGGDGLVCARHLFHFGYHPTVVYPKPASNPLYLSLMAQVRTLDLPVQTALPTEAPDVVVDAVFGFSFDPSNGIRAPFDTVVKAMASCGSPVVSVDIPSGWDVEKGDIAETGLNPAVLVSLSAPKMCASLLTASQRHFLGGRFVPPQLAREYGLELPPYPGSEQVVELPLLSSL